jgi:PhnB protein
VTPIEDQPAVQVQLSVRRGRDAVEFYRAAFGAVEIYRFGGSDDHEDVVCQLSVGGAPFWVEDESPADGNPGPETVGGSTERLLLVVDDPDVVVARAVALGATEVSPVGEEHGWRLGRVDDPFGHRWEVGHPLGPWPPEPPGGQPGRSGGGPGGGTRSGRTAPTRAVGPLNS